MKKGDRAEVVDSGERYRDYDEWVKRNAPALHSEFKASRCGTELRNGSKGTVIASAPHKDTYKKSLCLIRTDGANLYLIGERGLKLIERKADMTKDDLKTGKFELVTRNGCSALVKDGDFTKGYARSLTHDLRDENGDKAFDIVKVCEIKKIWQREEIKEIPMSQAVKDLQEKYGQNVKILTGE